jgi:hypothetical protein
MSCCWSLVRLSACGVDAAACYDGVCAEDCGDVCVDDRVEDCDGAFVDDCEFIGCAALAAAIPLPTISIIAAARAVVVRSFMERVLCRWRRPHLLNSGS